MLRNHLLLTKIRRNSYHQPDHSICFDAAPSTPRCNKPLGGGINWAIGQVQYLHFTKEGNGAPEIGSHYDVYGPQALKPSSIKKYTCIFKNFYNCTDTHSHTHHNNWWLSWSNSFIFAIKFLLDPKVTFNFSSKSSHVPTNSLQSGHVLPEEEVWAREVRWWKWVLNVYDMMEENLSMLLSFIVLSPGLPVKLSSTSLIFFTCNSNLWDSRAVFKNTSFHN